MRTIAPDLRMAPPRLLRGVLVGVLLIHAGLLAGMLALPQPTPVVAPPAPLYVRLIEPAAMQPSPAPPPRLQPPPPPARTAPATPLRPVTKAITAASQPPQPSETVRSENPRSEPQSEPRSAPAQTPASASIPAPAEAPQPTPAPSLPVTQPRFNADYLDNPKPPYPSAARRMGEEGEVRLRVHVDPAGNAQQVEVFRSSGFARLDQAALHTVKQWRFIPARQGDQPISAWVIVPIQFSLRS